MVSERSLESEVGVIFGLYVRRHTGATEHGWSLRSGRKLMLVGEPSGQGQRHMEFSINLRTVGCLRGFYSRLTGLGATAFQVGVSRPQ